MSTLSFATIKELRDQISRKTISAQELVRFFLNRAQKYDQSIKSILELFGEDSIIKACDQQGPLTGIPGFIKDNICQQGRTASCGSKILEHFVATYDATAIARLKQAGAPLLGRVNCDEFAMGSTTETSAFGPTFNPWDPSRVPGGSSGGSAAAVAAGFAPWALGSETGGSVRQPAAFCGIVGLKATYGLVSRYGLVAYASSLDSIGVMARSVHDTATVFSEIAGHDKRDSSSLNVDKKDYTALLNGKLPQGLRIGIVGNSLTAQGMDAEVRSAIETAIKQFEALGATVETVSLPMLDYAAAVYFIVSRAEAASNLARFDGVRYGLRNKQAQSLADMYSLSRHDGFGKEVRARIMTGNYVLSAGHAGQFYMNAKKVQRLLQHEYAQLFKKVDLLLMPTQAAPAFVCGAYDENKLAIDLQDYFTAPVNLAGIPAISIPCGFTHNKLPLGLQLIGPHLSEELILQAAHAYEVATPWHTMHPDRFVS